MWNAPSASGRSHLEAEARPQHRRRHTDAHGDKDERRDRARGRSHRAARACRGTRVQKIKPKSRLYIGSDLVSFEILRNSIQRRRCAAVGWYADFGGDGTVFCCFFSCFFFGQRARLYFSTGVMGSARPTYRRGPDDAEAETCGGGSKKNKKTRGGNRRCKGGYGIGLRREPPIWAIATASEPATQAVLNGGHTDTTKVPESAPVCSIVFFFSLSSFFALFRSLSLQRGTPYCITLVPCVSLFHSLCLSRSFFSSLLSFRL